MLNSGGPLARLGVTMVVSLATADHRVSPKTEIKNRQDVVVHDEGNCYSR